MAAVLASSEATSGPAKFDHSSLLKHAVHNNIFTNSTALQSEPSMTNNGLHDPTEFVDRPPLTKVNSSPATTTPVSNPTVHSKRRRRLTFRPRMTPLDLANPDSSNDQFRGFFTLFWLAMAFYVLQTVIRCYEQEGILLSLSFFRLFSKDGLALLVSDLTMRLALGSVRVLYSSYFGDDDEDAFVHVIEWGSVPQTPASEISKETYPEMDCGASQWRWKPADSDFAVIISNHSEKEYRGYSEEDAAQLRAMESEVEFIEEDLVHGKTVFPNNITLMNYLDYLLVPSLVYWMEYPRTDRIRPWYIFEKTVATLGSFLLLYVTTERYILPKLYDPTMSEMRVIVELLFPFMINYLLIFYIIFECILNAFAELSMFADRNFYDDWWNSVTYDEFARKWNKPVHHFLLRHVYASSMEAYKLTKMNATFLTFFLSSCLHELVLVIVTRKIRMYLFILQMLQIPLIVIGRHPIIRKRSWLGNAFFWAGMFVGPPLLGILYCREVFWSMKQAGAV
ncbi:unnamed protein product [Umbelopsis vinacea]